MSPATLSNDVVTPNENPLLQAAGPLLLLLGRLWVTLLRIPMAQLIERVGSEIQEFESRARAAKISAEQTRTAKYVLCATADDIVQNMPSEDRHLWTQHNMLSRFFGERVGGVRFFEELDRAKADPVTNYQLLELLHVCLTLGFQGVHRTSSGGVAMLQQIQRDLYQTLRRIKTPDLELSPRWQGQALAAPPVRAQVPVWAIGTVTCALLFALYLLLRTLLSSESEAIAASLIAMHPTSEVGIQRRVFQAPPPPPPPTRQINRIRAALKPPLEVEEKGSSIIIRMSNLALFAPASATMRDEFKPLVNQIASVIEKEPGQVKIIGHTDSAPMRSVRFPSNFHLSLERAKVIAEVIRAGVSRPERLSVEGKGDDIPLASNETADGRAKNRRVEIVIQRSD
ncbi:type VI secretion system protein TssL, long form [Microvirga sp. 0TCS3.31]